MPHLRARNILLKHRAIGVVVGRVAVDEAIQEERVHRESPVFWTGRVLVVFPFAPVVEGVCGGLVLVEVVCCVGWVVADGVDGGEDDHVGIV